MAYNNMQEVVHDEDYELAFRILFIASASLSLIEIIYFYCMKVQNVNLEMDTKTQKPRAKNKFVRGFGFCSIILCVTAILVG